MKKKIAVFTTGWCSEILSQFLTGIQNSLEKDSVDIFLFLCYPTYIDSSANKQGEMNIFSLPDISDFDGTIIFGSGLNFNDKIDNIIQRSKEAGVPVIMQGAKRDGIYYVGSDNYVATRTMCDHLENEHGVRNIIFIAGTTDSEDSELRLKAVRDFLEENGRSEDLKDVFYSKWENAAASQYIYDYCKSGKKLPDVFICTNDGLAMATCVALNENGYNVPEDVMITGYDFIDDSQIFDPSIASVDQCFTEMGEACGKLWLDLSRGKECDKSVVIPCEFIPGESCNCYSYRNSDKIRRRVGREAFSKRSMTTYFNRKLNLIDSTILSCLTYQEFKASLQKLLKENHDYEGDSFHVLLEPNFGLSIYDPGIKLRTTGYSRTLEVLYSTEDGISYKKETFSSKDLIPGYTADGRNHLYVFLPLHETDEAYGYIIFRDCMEKVNNHFLQTYQSRMGLVFDKFRHALSLDLINKRLLEVMKRDPLTNVNNRIAFDDKEKYLQSLINSSAKQNFAIAMFDVNNLKLVNDSKGHDAGDEYLIRACHLICNVFKHSPVYRLGGDEFVAILTGEDYKNRLDLINLLNSLMSPYSNKAPLPADYVSVACGVAVFDPSNDFSVQDVIKRADEEMYKNKAKIKGLA
jgi:diguanylate cyclase (GGDEF) domain